MKSPKYTTEFVDTNATPVFLQDMLKSASPKSMDQQALAIKTVRNFSYRSSTSGIVLTHNPLDEALLIGLSEEQAASHFSNLQQLLLEKGSEELPVKDGSKKSNVRISNVDKTSRSN